MDQPESTVGTPLAAKTKQEGRLMTRHAWMPLVFVTFALGFVAGGCTREDSCLSEEDCAADNEFCDIEPGFELVGDCKATCPTDDVPTDSQDCVLDGDCDSGNCDNDIEGARCTCVGDGAGGTAGSSGMGGSGGTRGVFERCQESTMVYCNNGYNCKDTWAVSDEVFEELYGPSLQECLDTSSCPTTEEEECSEGGTYSAENHEACISGQKNSNCEVEEVGGVVSPVFPAECDQICVQ